MVTREELNVVVLAHCILNQSTRWWLEGKPLRDSGMSIEILNGLAKLGIGILQMPCPEFTFCGNPRPPRTKKDYESLPGFVSHCQSLALQVAKEIRQLLSLSRKPKIRIIAVVGVERSPTCGVKLTPTLKDSNGRFGYSATKGLFIEYLEKELVQHGMSIPILGVDLKKPQSFLSSIRNLTTRVKTY